MPSYEQIKRLNAARFQLVVMKVPGLIVARTDAEAANLLERGVFGVTPVMSDGVGQARGDRIGTSQRL